MKKKNLISLTIAFAFLALSITGILLYIKQKAHAVEMTHTIFGLLFVGFAIFHIVNNWSSITGYSKERKSGKFQKELWVAGGIFLVLLVGGATEVLEPIAEGGRIFAGKRPPRATQLSFNEVVTNKDAQGKPLSILIEKDGKAELPVVAVWVEDSARNFVENLFVPAKVAAMPEDEEEAREGHFDISDFKSENLATWAGKAKSKTPNFEQETPHDNFILKTNTSAKGSFYVVMEVKSGAKNEIYEAAIDPSKAEVLKLKSKDGSLIKSAIVTL
ncbi:hypothetical protein Emtol_3452 [Emticicia oligotrophica DSM 17448]|uniref:Flavinylation-associated cytochrome domain-containing protein n=1 Tax=Emticicia oligotrophica (strain DSM 17448 / CIP 109782 / MTCC 6937 / GPTSA100-15) TaxID=929562 RepID=A0ABN4AQJ7_EMTOG|nr:DUF4405 domain-containing protein [Emticicia oligotrophica]AFK04580.1 hypothetical protein Emtol_3452 [Emticicia oligotrophica DSM 17448]